MKPVKITSDLLRAVGIDTPEDEVGILTVAMEDIRSMTQVGNGVDVKEIFDSLNSLNLMTQAIVSRYPKPSDASEELGDLVTEVVDMLKAASEVASLVEKALTGNTERLKKATTQAGSFVEKALKDFADKSEKAEAEEEEDDGLDVHVMEIKAKSREDALAQVSDIISGIVGKRVDVSGKGERLKEAASPKHD